MRLLLPLDRPESLPCAAGWLFLEVYPDDPRQLTDAELSARYAEFCNGYVCECGQVRDVELWTPEPGERFECAFCAEKRERAKREKTKR
jgi:hypothetical protein